MALPSTTDDFLALVRKSALVEAGTLRAYLKGRTDAEPLPAEPRRAARRLIRDGLLTRFQAEQLLGGKYKPFTIGRKYRLLERLGNGGMGFVYLCEHVVLKKRVAIKVLPTAQSESVAALERFRREARASATLDHPNLVRTHDLDCDGRTHFLVMDYVDGRSFQEIVAARGPLSVTRAVHYLAQAALGLQHIHECGLVHRDVKPGNLLLDRSGVVKVLDLGLARFFRDKSDDLTRQCGSRLVIGTADYVAPEQALDSHGADIRADIYSLGCTFYFLVTGRPPFHSAGSLGQKLMAHQMKDPPPLTAQCPKIPEGLAAVLRKMLAKAPEDRYQTPAEVADALRPWASTPIAPPSPEEMPKFCPALQGPGSTITSKNLTLSAIDLTSKAHGARTPSTPIPDVAMPAPAVPPVRLGVWSWLALAAGLFAAGLCGFLLR